MNNTFTQPFSLHGKVAVVTGAGGVLCSVMANGLAAAGAKVALCGRRLETLQPHADAINASGGEGRAYLMNVLYRESVQEACDKILADFGQVDILVNGAGGNKKEATTSDEMPFFDLPPDAVEWVFNLNFIGTLLPSQVFGKVFAEQGEGTILNISSMNSIRPLTRIPAYSAAKAAVTNFTQWLAVHLAQNYSPKIRVNALAPGFFLTEQNRFLLLDAQSGELTARGQSIIAHTPQNRFGDPEDLLGAMLFLLSPSASFVTGITLPVDGGFSAFSGV